MEEIVSILMIALRILGVVVCIKKAEELNRNKGGWGFFGFISPILAMIWIQFMKPVTDWSDESGQ